MKILSFGEIVWDEYPDKRCIGGAPLNFAAHVQKCGAESFLLSAVGNDEKGELTKKELARLNVNDSFVKTVNGKETGRCNVTLDERGTPAYELLKDCAYDYIPFSDGLTDISFDALAFGTLALRQANNARTLRKIFKAGICRKKYCDLNLRAPFYTSKIVGFCLENADIVKLSEDELSYAANTFVPTGKGLEEKMKNLAEKFKNLETIVVTLGEKGSVAYERKSDVFTACAAEKTEVVSTVGAGDSFGAAFLAAYLSGEGIKSCLQKGARQSAFVVAHTEAIPFE